MHAMIYHIHWDNSLQWASYKVVELHQTILMRSNKHPFVWHHTNKEFATWHVLYTSILKYFTNNLSL